VTVNTSLIKGLEPDKMSNAVKAAANKNSWKKTQSELEVP